MRPSSHFLLTKWPTTSVEFETPDLDAVSVFGKGDQNGRMCLLLE